MKPILKLSLATAIAMFLASGPGVVEAQKGKKPPPPPSIVPIQLEATFDALLTGIVADGTYQTTNQGEVEIDEEGALTFSVQKRAGRSLFFDFTHPLRVGVPGAPIPGPDDPVDEWYFATRGERVAYAEPRVNLQTMTPGQTAPVQLWFQFTSEAGELFKLVAAPPVESGWTGSVVQVTALDENDSGTVDCWIFEPLSGTDSGFNLKWAAQWKGGQGWIYQDAGDYSLPFRIEFRDPAGR